MELQHLYALLCDGHMQAQGVVDTLPTPVLVLDPDLRITAVNDAFLHGFRAERGQTIGESLFKLGDGQWDIPELRTLLIEIAPRATSVTDYRLTHDVPGVGERTILVGARQLVGAGGQGKNILMTFDDVTERDRTEAAKDVLVAETQHRMRNLLGVVRALAAQTGTAGRTGVEYRDALLGRIEVMARSQETSPAGEPAADLGELLARTLEPFGAGRLRLAPGPPVRLAAEQVLPISLILHELGTNSLKYGALSVPGGVVKVAWDAPGRTNRANLVLDWREEGGPPVAPPAQSGFGTRLIEFSARTSLGGEAELFFEPRGLHARITVPIDEGCHSSENAT